MAHSYYVVMRDFGRLGLEASIDPEITRREVISRLRSTEYDRVVFIHHIHDGVCEDVTDDVLAEAGALEEVA